MPRTTTLIVGCGYLGRRVGRLLSMRGERVFGTTRSAERADELARWGIEPVIADVLTPGSLAGLPEANRVLYCVGFDRSKGMPIRMVSVDGLRHALGHLIDRAGRLVFASSTGVYGQVDGEWVDEDSPTEPRTESGRATLDAEKVVRSYGADCGLQAVILRFSGLYGPGRIMRRESLLKGEPIAGDPDKFLNLIHIDDAASVAVAALDRGRSGGLYLASDDRPAPRREFYGLAAEGLKAAPPRFSATGAEDSNKRVKNARMRAELGVILAYPDIRAGVPTAIDAEVGA